MCAKCKKHATCKKWCPLLWLVCIIFFFYYELIVFISLGPFDLCESPLAYHTAGEGGKFSCPLFLCSGLPADSLDTSHQQGSRKPLGG